MQFLLPSTQTSKDYHIFHTTYFNQLFSKSILPQTSCDFTAHWQVPFHFQKPSWWWFLSLHCAGLDLRERYFFFVWKKKCAFPQQASSPPCKETPGVYIAWERLRPKIGPVSDNLQHDAATFPFSTVQHCFLGEFRVKLGGIFRIFARRQSVSRISIERIDWTRSVSI